MRFKCMREDLELVQATYAGLQDELDNGGYTDHDKSMLGDPHLYYGNYLNSRSRNYFSSVVLPPIASAIDFLKIRENSGQHIADVGCGGGMQSLIFASLGMHVVGFDLRADSVALCNKRKTYFEKRLNKTLDATFVQTDFGQADKLGFDRRFDSAFSMSAFSYMRPMENTVRVLDTMLKSQARVFLFERNADHLADSYKYSEPVAAPGKVSAEFERLGFEVDFLSGTCAIPKNLWFSPLLNKAWEPINAVLSRNLRLSTNYVLGLARSAPATMAVGAADVRFAQTKAPPLPVK